MRKKITGYIGGFIFLKPGDLYSSIFGNLLNGHESSGVLRYDVI